MANGSDNSSCAPPPGGNRFGGGRPGGGNMMPPARPNVGDHADAVVEAAEEFEAGPVQVEVVADYDAEQEPEFQDLQQFQNNFSAGKNKWILEPGLLAGKSSDRVVDIYPISQDPRARNAFPPNIPPPNINAPVLDTFRFATGKFWMNLAHGAGPLNGLNSFLENRRDNGPYGLFSFHNPGHVLGHASHFLTPATMNDRLTGKILSQFDWLESDAIRLRFTRGANQVLTLPVYHDTMKIVFPAHALQSPPPLPDPPQTGLFWNWRNYMYGLAEGFGDDLFTARSAAQDPTRFDYNNRGANSLLTWRDWQSADWSKNLFPVIPFYGVYFANNSPTDWSNESLRPPAKGEQTFFDHATNTPAFLTREQLNQTDVRVSSYLDIDPVYNYYDCVYEDLISPNYEEKRLPNYYKMRPERRDLSNRANEEWARDAIARNMPEEEGSRQQEILRRKAIEQYGVFDNIGHPFIKAWDIYENTNLPDFKRVFDERSLFPMYTELELKTTTDSTFASAMRLGPGRSSMREILLPFASKNDPSTEDILQGVGQLVQSVNAETVTQFIGSGNDDPAGDALGTTSVGDTVEEPVKFMDLNRWLAWVEETLTPEDPISPQERFRNLFSSMTIKARLKKLIEEKYRQNFNEILSGVPAYSEVLAYRIEKMVEGEPIQNFYFGTDNDVEIVKYIDSQVEYGTRYTYKVYQTIIVVGTEYAYADCMSNASVRSFFNNSVPLRTTEMFFGVIHTPSVRIMEVPMQEREIVILDRPPMPPDVNVIPFKGVANRILFNLNSGTGELYAPPIILEEDDNEQFAAVATNQEATFNPESWLPPGGIASPDQVLHFKNDDQTKIFEAFRLDHEPESWQDFYDKKIARIASTATNASLEDVVTPNKKYYYTFRSEDTHGHVSNPTHIYQVEMVKNSETVYMKMDLYKFKEPAKSTTASFKKSIQISPAFLQKILPLPSSGMFSDWEGDMQVGNSSNPVWGKKFKFRITSKSTGKQIDLNFKFVKKYARIPEEVQNTVHNSDKC